MNSSVSLSITLTLTLTLGVCSLFPNLKDRLQAEIVQQHTRWGPQVTVPPDAMNTVWRGGSTLASLSTMGSMWISKSEYDEAGPRIVHTKCQM